MKINSKAQPQPSLNAEIDYRPLIELFGLLLEWDMKDVQEKEEKRKKVS